MPTPSLRTCHNGHQYTKSSDCPVCPFCEQLKKPADGFLSLLSAPARRALEREKLVNLKSLSTITEKELLKLHGVGPASLPILRKALKEAGLSFATAAKTIVKRDV
ncbi:MAG TPA: RNA polymerase alpha subunit C-terminal domain-containing protein [Ferruginibacter sp.]|nr:RNA polymerase alpha subunit C-terminal domain-containing protein [Ferruginibacter sp.]